jgi:hypothetical protein
VAPPAVAARGLARALVGSSRRPPTGNTGSLVALDAAAKLFRDNIPTVHDEVVVEVVGQPGASKQELYYLAMAAAFGIVRRLQPLLQLNPFLPPSAASLMIEYDAADHWVRCSLTYRSAALRTLGARVASTVPSIPSPVIDFAIGAFTYIVPRGALIAAVASLLPDPGFFDGMAVYRGPQCNVVGGEFDLTDSILPGIPGLSPPGAAGSRGEPVMPWTGKTILTGCPTAPDPRPIGPIKQEPPPDRKLISPGPDIPSPNPKPSGDNRSRGSVVTPGPAKTLGASGCCPKTMLLVELVAASLTDPGSNAMETWTPPVAGPGAAAGSPVGG